MGAAPGTREYGGLADRLSRIEKRLADLERGNRLPSASVGSGGLTIRDAGALRLLDTSGDVLVTLDTSGVDIAAGLVQLTQAGLSVDGGLVRAVHVDYGIDQFSNATITTTQATIVSREFTYPSWCQTAWVLGWGSIQLSNSTGGVVGLEAAIRYLTDGGSQYQDIQAGGIGSVTVPRVWSVDLETDPTPTVALDARVSSGTSSANLGYLVTLTIGLRN
jgi:hypothetical protein